MTDPQIAVFMLGIFIFTILLGFPIAFTLVAMGVGFGYYAYFDAERMHSLFDNRIFDLLVNQTYSVMANDVLTAVPLFLFMGYIVERANIVDRLFHTLYIASRRMPGSMAIAALATCAMFATATGIIGAVVTLMGLLAFPAMLKARYDISFAAGVICAGGCLGILIPPSIMLIVYSATSNVSVVKLYAGAILPGFMLAGLYIIYVIGRAILNPSLAPKPRAEDIPDVTGRQVLFAMMTSFFPLAFLIFAVLGSILFGLATPSEAASMGALGGMFLAVAYRLAGIKQGLVKPVWEGQPWSQLDGWLFSLGFGGIATLIIAVIYVVLYLIVDNVVGVELVSEPGFLIRPGAGIGLAVIIALLTRVMPGRVPLLGWLWPERDALKRTYAYAGRGAVIGSFFEIVYLLCFTVFGLNATFTNHKVNWLGLDIGFFIGLATYFAWKVNDQDRLREFYLSHGAHIGDGVLAVRRFLDLLVGLLLFGRRAARSRNIVLSMDLSTVTFLLMAQVIIFLLGWPLEWSEIIIIFVPIFLPLATAFQRRPVVLRNPRGA